MVGYVTTAVVYIVSMKAASQTTGRVWADVMENSVMTSVHKVCIPLL
jgi:hypothetical protein